MDRRVRILRLAAPIVAGLSIVTAPSVVSAEPVTVTSGYFYIAWDDPTDFEFVGTDGFVLNSSGVFTPVSPQETCFAGCTPGTSVNLGAVAGGESPQIPFTLGMTFDASVINGTIYGDAGGGVGLAGTFQFEAPTIVLPPIVSGGAEAVFMAPFVFTGTASGFARDDVARTSPLFSVNLQGQGTARFGMATFRGSYTHPAVTYTFENVSAVPEPTSLTLLASGLVGLAVRFRARRSRLAEGSSKAP